MYCRKCGAEVPNNVGFCPKCGTSVETPINVKHITTVKPRKIKGIKKEKKVISKGKKAKIIFISVFATIAVIFVSIAATYFTSPAYGVYKSLKQINCDSAISEYTESVEDNFIQKIFIKIALNGYGEKIINKFKDDKIDFEDALSILEAMKEMNIKDIDKYIDELNGLNRSKTAFDMANKYYKENDYENAIKEYSKIIDTDTQFTDAQAKLAELYPKYANAISEKAKQLSATGDCAGALSLINTALVILPDGSSGREELSKSKEECLEAYKKEVTETVTAMITEKSYVDAIGFINKAIEVDNNEDFQNLKATVEKEYIKNVTAAVDNFINQEDYISASRTVNSALDILPENADLKALKEKVVKATPTYLLDVCKPYQVSDYYYKEYINGEIFNMGGKSFTNGFTINTSWNDFSYAIFNLENNYTQLSFYTGHVDNTDNGNGKIKIYLDGILEKEIEANDQALPQKININITGVKQLKFEVTYAGGEYGFGNVIVK